MEDPARDAVVSAVAPALEDLTSLVEQWAREAGMYEVGVRVQSDAAMARFARLAFEAGRAKGLEEAAEACADVEERPWYGYENPNTFDDGKRACASAIRSLAPAVPI